MTATHHFAQPRHMAGRAEPRWILAPLILLFSAMLSGFQTTLVREELLPALPKGSQWVPSKVLFRD